MSPATTSAARTARNTEVATALGVLFILALLIVPLPGLVVDLFLALSLGASLAAAFAVLKLLLGRPLIHAPAIPLDSTLPIALGAGIPLAEAIAHTALTAAAGAPWSVLSSSAPIGAYA